MQTINFKISGLYLNGDAYRDSHYNIFELQDLLEELQNNYEAYYGNNKPGFSKSDIVDMESINIAMTNPDGDELPFHDYDKSRNLNDDKRLIKQ